LLDKNKIEKIFKEIFKDGIVSYWKELPSTQEYAVNFPVEFPLLVIAEKQTKSFGRRGRKWYSPEGGLWFTFSIGENFIRNKRNLSVRIGRVVKNAIKIKTGLNLKIKIPNDILYKGKKLCGILITKSIGRYHIGVGINVNNHPPLKTATSIKSITGSNTDLNLLLFEILRKIKEEIVI